MLVSYIVVFYDAGIIPIPEYTLRHHPYSIYSTTHLLLPLFIIPSSRT